MTGSWKEKAIGAMGGVSGATSLLGSWQICHSICTWLITALGIIGITLTGMPLAFLITIALPLWVISIILLGVSAILYYTKKCVSKWMLTMNSGLIIAATPLAKAPPLTYVLWAAGGTIAVAGLILLLIERKNKTCHK